MLSPHVSPTPRAGGGEGEVRDGVAARPSEAAGRGPRAKPVSCCAS